MPIQRRITAPETLPPIKPKLVIPELACDRDFMETVTRLPKTGSMWREEALRKLWIYPLEQREWIVNTYPMFIRVINTIERLRGQSEPLRQVRGLAVFARIAEQPQHPQFVRIETSVPSERLEQVALFVYHLAKAKRTPHVDEDQKQAGYS